MPAYSFCHGYAVPPSSQRKAFGRRTNSPFVSVCRYKTKARAVNDRPYIVVMVTSQTVGVIIDRPRYLKSIRRFSLRFLNRINQNIHRFQIPVKTLALDRCNAT